MDKDRSRLDQVRDHAPSVDEGFAELQRRRTRQERRRRSTSLVVALLIGVAGVGTAVVALRPAAPESVSPLRSQPGIGPDTFVHTELIRYLPNPAEQGWVRCVDESWVRADGAGRIVRAYEAGCLPRLAGGEDQDRGYAPGEMPGADVRNLSSDPAVLAKQLVGAAQPSAAPASPPGATPSAATRDPETARLAAVVSLLDSRWSYPAPDVRAALVQIVRGSDLAEELRDQTDPAGRTASLLSFPIGSDQTAQLYVAAGTGQPLALTVVDGSGEMVRIDVIASSELTDTNRVAAASQEDLIPAAVRDVQLP
jgi:hypothetical protein